MPPDDMVIARIGGENEKSFKVLGSLVSEEYNRWKNFSDVQVFWTEFTPEKLEHLTREPIVNSIDSYDPSSPNGYD